MGITNQQYIKRIANTSIGASTLRGHPKGTIKKTQGYLEEIQLEEFCRRNSKEFGEILDKHTHALSKEIRDSSSAYWGSARKALNLLLENAAYHSVLRKEYRLDEIEPFMEIPLDRQVAEHLIECAMKRNKTLPRWKTIKDLIIDDSNVYQDFALVFAKEKECTRIQLDVLLWRNKDFRCD